MYICIHRDIYILYMCIYTYISYTLKILKYIFILYKIIFYIILIFYSIIKIKIMSIFLESKVTIMHGLGA